jgi:hypothetical protein
LQAWDVASPAIKVALNRGVEIATHVLGAEERINGRLIDIAIMVIGVVELNDHVGVGAVVTDPVNEATAFY